MKNMNLKTKLIARAMFFVVLLASAINFSGCTTKSTVNRSLHYKSHANLIKFIEKYNSKNDGFVNTFISFDFDNNDDVVPYCYYLNTLGTIKRSRITRESEYAELYDADHHYGFWGEYCFHMEDPTVQIQCTWYMKDYNFYQDDEISVEFIDNFSIYDEDKTIELMMDYGYENFDSFREDMGDRRTLLISQEHRYEKQYSYVYFYQIKVNGEDMVFVKIYTETEFENEKLDEICQLLLDNMVIINTEG